MTIRARCDFDAARSHFIERRFDISRLKIHAAAGIGAEMHSEARVDGVERGEFYAVISRESGDENLAHIALAQPLGEAGRMAVAVVKKAAVAVHGCVSAFLKNVFDAPRIEARREARAASVLHAMHGPENLP